MIALFALIATMTYFLISEAAGFCLDAHETPLCAYLKAGMVEGIAILFSFSRAKGTVLRWSQRTIVVLLCGLTLWTMCGKIFSTAVSDSAKSQTMARAIQELEREHSQKEKLRQELISRGWIGATRRYEKNLDQIRQRLFVARQEASKMESPHVIMNSLGILIVFRLLIVAANLICIHHVTEQLGFRAAHNQELSAA